MDNTIDRQRAVQLASTRAQWAFIAICVVLVSAFMCLGTYLAYDALSSNGREMVRSRFALSAERVALTAQRAMSTGLELSTQTTLPAVLRRASDQDPAILSFDVIDPRGIVMFSAEPTRAGQPVDKADDNVVSHDLLDDLGQRQGTVQVRFGQDLLGNLDKRFASALQTGLLLPLSLSCLIMALGGMGLMRLAQATCHPPSQSTRIRWAALLKPGFRGSLSMLAGAVLAAALAALHWQATGIAQEALPPQMVAKAQSVARASSAQVALAIEMGIPLAHLRGVEAHFDALLKAGPEIAAMTLLDAHGRTVFSRGVMLPPGQSLAVSESVMVHGSSVAEIRVNIDDQVLERRLRANALDTGFLALVVLLIANELIALLGTLSLSRHLIELDRQLEQRLKSDATISLGGASPAATAMRPVLFLFMLGEELIRAFLPNYARALVPASLDNATTWGGVPLVLFLVVVALCQLPFASLSLRLGRRRGLTWGAVLSAVGYALSGLTSDFWVFTLARVVTALGFALVFVSSQGAVMDSCDDRNRPSSFAVFVRAILVAGLCGPPLGGLLADRLGIPVVFALGTLLCLLAAILARHSVASPKMNGAAEQSADDSIRTASLFAVWHSPGLRGLILGSAVPAKLMLTATCFYLVPIGLAEQGYSSSEIGRSLMIYPLLMVLGVGIMASWARRLNRPRTFVIWGGLLAGAGGLLGLTRMGDTSVLIMLVMLGIGQAMSITSQTDLVVRLAQRVHGQSVSQVLGLFRMLERGGSALGPAVGAGLLGALGLGSAIALTGGVVIAGSLLFAWQSRHDNPSA